MKADFTGSPESVYFWVDAGITFQACNRVSAAPPRKVFYERNETRHAHSGLGQRFPEIHHARQ
uniref:hypothetical protein n=1 Tax=Gluconobacter japonicus TaxID=376620 RepID=UPI0039ED8D04